MRALFALFDPILGSSFCLFCFAIPGSFFFVFPFLLHSPLNFHCSPLPFDLLSSRFNLKLLIWLCFSFSQTFPIYMGISCERKTPLCFFSTNGFPAAPLGEAASEQKRFQDIFCCNKPSNKKTDSNNKSPHINIFVVANSRTKGDHAPH